MPAPTPRWGAPDETTAPKPRPQEFYDKNRPPADDAPIADLLDYWRRWADTGDRPPPSTTVQGRMLDEYNTHPEDLPDTLAAFQPSEEIAAKVKDLYDNALNDRKMTGSWRDLVKTWLLLNTKYFINELQTLAGKVRDDDKEGDLYRGEALIGLATVDWSLAEPLVQRLANSDQRRSVAFALALLYKQAVTAKDSSGEEKYRAQLQAIASDREALAYSRNAAIETLSLSKWSGRDDWYLSLFPDETLASLHDTNWFSPLTTLCAKDPDKWIPVMSKLVESKDQTIKNAAVSCLIIFQNERAREDALKPLLPWLSNPAWAENHSMGRLRLIQSMGNVDLPESVPGLIWVIEHDNSESGSDRAYAAESLAKYKDSRAIPALKKALGLAKDARQRQLILTGLLACGGFSEAEQVDALEAYAAEIAISAAGEEAFLISRGYGAETPSLQISIGHFVRMIVDPPETLVRAVLVRADTLTKSKPAVAQVLLEVAHQWRGKQVQLDLIQRIADGNHGVSTIVTALVRRSELRESVLPELQGLAGAPGLAPGVAAVLLDDASLAQSVLSSGSESAQIALLGCARFVQMPLPVDVVGTLLKRKNELLALAAESYLLAEDSNEARELLWSHHPNAAFVTGWREEPPNISGNFDAMDKLEERFRAELFKDNAPIETFALLTNNPQYGRVLRVYPDKAVFTHYEDPARYKERTITKEELSAFRQFITTSNLATRGPQFGECHYDCARSEFLILSKEKGRRVSARERYRGWEELLRQFHSLGTGDGAKFHYNLENEIKGLEVLYADKTSTVRDIRQAKDELRILLVREETPDESESSESSDEEEELTPGARRRKLLARILGGYSWHVLQNDKVGPVTAEPPDYAAFDHVRFLSDDEESEVLPDRSESPLIGPNSMVMALNFEGLWRKDAGQKAVRISGEGGAYAHPIVTPDSKWVVVAKTDIDWSLPNYVVRFNLQTGREFRVPLPPAEEFSPIAYVAPHDKILLRRAGESYQSSAKSIGPQVPEYYLLDAATGKTGLVSGNFEPLRQDGTRFLQPTGNPNEFWAALPDKQKDQTQVGRYNLKDFSFQQVLLVPHILFDSMAMWVQHDATKFFLVYDGHLLRVPLGKIQH